MWSKWVKTLIAAAFVFVGLTLFSSKALAVPADSKLREFQQPNGTKFYAAMHGDEWFNWVEAKDGAVLAQGNDGYWCYSQFKDGEIQPTSAKYLIGKKPNNALSKSNIESIVKNKSVVLPKYSKVKLQPEITGMQLKDKLSSKNVQTLDSPETQPMVIFLINYRNQTLNYNPNDYKEMFFNTSSKSVNKFYSDVSNEMFQFTPVNENQGTPGDGIITVSLPIDHPNTANKINYYEIWPVIRETLSQAQNYINFSLYDTDRNGYVTRDELHTVFVSAGWEYSAPYGLAGPSIWAHSWALQNDSDGPTQTDYRFISNGVYVCTYDEVNGDVMDGGYTIQSEMHGAHLMTMGTVSHELGHDIGLPDEYDYGYDSMGVGIHSIMASGSWAAAAGGYAGSSPTYLDAFSRWYLGFADYEEVAGKGKYSVKAITANSSDPDLLIIPSANPFEFFLVENRQYKGFDASLKGCTKSSGILIEHVDFALYLASEAEGFRMNDDQNHKAVDVEEANEGKLGYSQLDNNISEDIVIYDHYYYSGGNKEFTSKSVPNSKLYDGNTSSDIAISSKSGDVMTIDVKGIADVAAPEIISTTPKLTLTTIPDILQSKKNIVTLNSKVTKISVKFSKPVFPNNAGEDNTKGNLGWIYLTDTDHAALIPGELTIKGDTITLTPQKDLVPGVTYRFRLAGESLKDQYGNVFPIQKYDRYTYSYYDYYFIIKDTVAPSVVIAPFKNNAKNISVKQELAFDFGEDILEGTVFNKIAIKDKSGNIVPINVNISGSSILIVPVNGSEPVDLSYNMKYTLSIPAGALKDKAGNKSKSYSVTFTTENSPAPPVVVNYTIKKASKGSSITVTFDKDIYIADKTLICYKDENGNIIKASVKAVNNLLYIVPAAKLKTGVKYTLIIQSGAVKDTSGNIFDKILNIEL